MESPFDAAAASYDADFSDRPVGRALRRLVWEQLELVFEPGQRVLELGCGTGEDAIWLGRRGVHVVATDQSTVMLEVAAAKAERAGVADRIRWAHLDLHRVLASEPPARPPFDGVLADFGVLNCLADRGALAHALAAWLRPGAPVVLVVMTRWCLVEMLTGTLRLDFRKALRRMRQGRPVAVGGGGTVRTHYLGWRELRTDFAEHFVLRQRRAIGLVVPPPDLGRTLEGKPCLLAGLVAWDRRLAPLLPGLGDHVLVVLERRS